MRGKLRAVLLLILLAAWTAGVGCMPVRPVRATRLAPTPPLIGCYLATAYSAIVPGFVAAGGAFARVKRPRMLRLSAGAPCILCVLFMGRVTTVWEPAALNGATAFIFGAGLALNGGALVAAIRRPAMPPMTKGGIGNPPYCSKEENAMKRKRLLLPMVGLGLVVLLSAACGTFQPAPAPASLTPASLPSTAVPVPTTATSAP